MLCSVWSLAAGVGCVVSCLRHTEACLPCVFCVCRLRLGWRELQQLADRRCRCDSHTHVHGYDWMSCCVRSWLQALAAFSASSGILLFGRACGVRLVCCRKWHCCCLVPGMRVARLLVVVPILSYAFSFCLLLEQCVYWLGNCGYNCGCVGTSVTLFVQCIQALFVELW